MKEKNPSETKDDSKDESKEDKYQHGGLDAEKLMKKVKLLMEIRERDKGKGR